MDTKVEKVPVSVIIPCYCCDDTIERAVESVIRQTVLPAEILLVNDASPDDGRTLAALNRLQKCYGDKTSIEIIHLENNCGPSLTRNIGWERASQPFIAFLDADDAWHSRKIEIQYNWMKDYPEVALTGHPCFMNESGTELKLPTNWPARPISPLGLLFSNRIPTRSVMLKRELPYRFEPSKRYSEDYLLWLQIALDKCPVWRLELPLAYIYKANFGEKGLSAGLWQMEKGELDTYWRLCRGGSVPSFVGVWFMLWSLLKYLRRLVIKVMKQW